ncbi:phosphatidate cytidylyltransferase [Moraxella oblonga]|uniref:phosphatidate cytidylyltransferase n=1 Tax=Moraxella oblonga TaxID=200413 RepID=UPI000833CB27|nr:phosphatidate cytidylyltransferase [Moraxella oblonga]
MWQRIKTAIVLVLIVGIAMFATDKPYLFLPLLLVGVAIASYEWTKLMPTFPAKSAFVVPVFAITVVSLLIKPTWAVWWAGSVLFWVQAGIWVKQYPAKDNWRNQGLFGAGVLALVPAITAMYALWQLSAWWLLYVFVLVWCADSGAYFVGRKLGKKKLAPNVSPNKSLEGLYGGVATASLVAVGVGLYLGLDMATLLVFLLLSAVVVGVSVLGDLFESMLKRRAGVKDSGTILPGHGGVLDRIDSLLSATPIFAFGILICDWLGIKFTPHFVMAHQLFGG